MPQTTISHLSSVGLDHCPLLMEMVGTNENNIKYLKFLNCWVDNEGFMDVVKSCWNREITGNPIWYFHHKNEKISCYSQQLV